MNLGDIIKESREKKNLSVYSLAKESGLSRAYLVKLEKNESWPTLETLRKIARPLGYSLVEIVELLEGSRVLYKTNISEVEERISKDKSFFSYPLTSRSHDRSIEMFAFQFHGVGEHLAIRPRGASVGLFVQKGEMEFELNNQSISLKGGDFVQFSISKRYKYRQTSRKLAEGIVVIRYP